MNPDIPIPSIETPSEPAEERATSPPRPGRIQDTHRLLQKFRSLAADFGFLKFAGLLSRMQTVHNNALINQWRAEVTRDPYLGAVADVKVALVVIRSSAPYIRRIINATTLHQLAHWTNEYDRAPAAEVRVLWHVKQFIAANLDIFPGSIIVANGINTKLMTGDVQRVCSLLSFIVDLLLSAISMDDIVALDSAFPCQSLPRSQFASTSGLAAADQGFPGAIQSQYPNDFEDIFLELSRLKSPRPGQEEATQLSQQECQQIAQQILRNISETLSDPQLARPSFPSQTPQPMSQQMTQIVVHRLAQHMPQMMADRLAQEMARIIPQQLSRQASPRLPQQTPVLLSQLIPPLPSAQPRPVSPQIPQQGFRQRLQQTPLPPPPSMTPVSPFASAQSNTDLIPPQAPQQTPSPPFPSIPSQPVFQSTSQQPSQIGLQQTPFSPSRSFFPQSFAQSTPYTSTQQVSQKAPEETPFPPPLSIPPLPSGLATPEAAPHGASQQASASKTDTLPPPSEDFICLQDIENQNLK